MHIHISLRRWVVWWLYVGVVLGIIALTNIFLRDLSAMDDELILSMGVLHWALGGLVCYAYGGIQLRKSPEQKSAAPPEILHAEEWHPASDFVLPGTHRNRLLPPRYADTHQPAVR